MAFRPELIRILGPAAKSWFVDDLSVFRALGWDNCIPSAMFFHVKDVLFHVNMKKHPAAKAQNVLRQRRRQEIIASEYFIKGIQRGMTARGEHIDNPTLDLTIQKMIFSMVLISEILIPLHIRQDLIMWMI